MFRGSALSVTNRRIGLLNIACDIHKSWQAQNPAHWDPYLAGLGVDNAACSGVGLLPPLLDEGPPPPCDPLPPPPTAVAHVGSEDAPFSSVSPAGPSRRLQVTDGLTCANAIPYTVSSGSIVASNFGASVGPASYDASQCPSTAFTGGTSNVMWLRVADSAWHTGSFLYLSACGFDTDLSVFKGTCSSLTQVACDGDSGGTGSCGITFSSKISAVEVESGPTYYIVLGGYGGQTGTATISGILQLVGSSAATSAS